MSPPAPIRTALGWDARLRVLLRPLAGRLAGRGVAADRLWRALPLVAAPVGALLALAPGSVAPLLLLPLSLALCHGLGLVADMLDGEYDLAGPRAAVWQPVGAALTEAALYMPLALQPGVPAALVVALVVLGLIAETARLAAARASRGGARPPGPLGTGNRALVFALLALILAADPRAAPWLPWLLLPALGAAALTIHNRLRLPPLPAVADAGAGDVGRAAGADADADADAGDD